jgi:hypothetical protein
MARCNFVATLCPCQHYKTYLGFHIKCPMFLFDFNRIWVFVTNFSKSPPIRNFVKMCPVGEELIHADREASRWTDVTKLIGAFRSLQTH